uniref:Uncharacterized protein n=1 Tax=viral metagenome TaxID=1070528 RepID=A0A6C0JY43_9ZZZZ
MNAYNGICPPNVNINKFFKEIIDRDNITEINLFLDNLKGNFLNNFIFDYGKEFSLGYACENDKFNTALSLIKSGDVVLGQKNKNGRTPLILCTGNEDEMSAIVAEELLKGDCKPDAKYSTGRTALMRCCNYKTNPDIKIASMLLDRDPNLGFQLDDDGYSGLDLLIEFNNENEKKELLRDKMYRNLCVKYLKIYSDGDLSDGVFARVMEIICNDKDDLRPALDRPLLQKGINLNNYCDESHKTIEAVATTLKATLVAPNLQEKMQIPKAEAVPFAVGERIAGVSPGHRYVPDEIRDPEGFARYERLYPPGKGPNAGPGGGPAGGKKCKTIKRRSLKRNKKSKRQKC